MRHAGIHRNPILFKLILAILSCRRGTQTCPRRTILPLRTEENSKRLDTCGATLAANSRTLSARQALSRHVETVTVAHAYLPLLLRKQDTGIGHARTPPRSLLPHTCLNSTFQNIKIFTCRIHVPQQINSQLKKTCRNT